MYKKSENIQPDPGEKDYSTQERIVGDMKKAKIAVENLRLTQDLINTYIIEALTQEELVAISLFRKGITEADFFSMKRHLFIDEPRFIKIANYLRDHWSRTNTGNTKLG